PLSWRRPPRVTVSVPALIQQRWPPIVQLSRRCGSSLPSRRRSFLNRTPLMSFWSAISASVYVDLTSQALECPSCLLQTVHPRCVERDAGRQGHGVVERVELEWRQVEHELSPTAHAADPQPPGPMPAARGAKRRRTPPAA